MREGLISSLYEPGGGCTPAHGWEFTPLCTEELMMEGDPTGDFPLHKQAQRDANSKAPKAQAPSPPCSVP